ncbi:maltose acetyltransferase domain-containing protein [Dolosigranulum pigrum]|uniref:maltose acetyltransferase domain-containing protein n=1 Tax=Dolosigranulum pigrum TaxID=29394 RepID=UPI003137D0BF
MNKHEYNKMIRGELYDPRDPYLRDLMTKQHALMDAFNESDRTDHATQNKLLEELLGHFLSIMASILRLVSISLLIIIVQCWMSPRLRSVKTSCSGPTLA